MDVTMICLSLLQLVAFAMGTRLFSNVYRRYSGSTTLIGNALEFTTAPSAVQCLRLCSGYEHTSSESYDAARYNEVTCSCELMSRKSTGAVQWQVSDKWKVFVSKCQVDWTMFDGSCYYLFHIRRDRDAAKHACEQVDASLASITSKEEDDFTNAMLNGIGGNYVYIGAKKGAGEQWKWESGEVWAYEHFAAGQPNHGTDEVSIGILYNNGWYDLHGSINYFLYLCEKGIWF